MRNYRLYRLDGAGKIVSADWIEAHSDAQALNDARRDCGGYFELWDRDRLIESARPGR